MNKNTAQIQFISISPTDLISELKNAIVPELEEKLSKNFQPKEPAKYLTRNEVCELLFIDLSTLYRWTKNKTLKAIYIGNRVYYDRKDIDELMNKNKIN